MILTLLLAILGLGPVHDLGYTGRGITVALIDEGFYRADSLYGDHILAAYDLLPDSLQARYGDIFSTPAETHGTSCLSTILGGDGRVGTAPDVSVILFRTEDHIYEYRDEVDRLARALYMADSLDVDVITCSLGYRTFDDPTTDYTPDSLDGRTTSAAIAASEVGQRRIVCISAGNEGNTAWHYITTPADAFHILAVGAVDSMGHHAPFSGYGPSADGRVKPEVAAWGQNTWVRGTSGWYRANGTSFACPEVAGMMACLRQALPTLPSDSLYSIVLRSADRYTMPNDSLGYGVPNAALALDIATDIREIYMPDDASAPSSEIFLRRGSLYIRRGNVLYDLSGRRVY